MSEEISGRTAIVTGASEATARTLTDATKWVSTAGRRPCAGNCSPTCS
jgi:NADP-dependent 3-hydroxy acid dehydrogenase YdfG